MDKITLKTITRILISEGYNIPHKDYVNPFAYTTNGAKQLSILTHYFMQKHLTHIYDRFEDPNFHPKQSMDMDTLSKMFWQDEVNRIKYCLKQLK